MTPSDAQRIERLIKQLRKDARLFPNMESIRKAADEIERLRGVEANARRYRWLQDNFVTFADEHGNHICLGIYGKNLDSAIDAAIAASRSTGAADVGEER